MSDPTNLTPPADAPLPWRLRVKIIANGATGCWNWTGYRGATGYGRAWFQGRTRQAHRVVYTLLVGEIPAGLSLDHLCRNPACVNPDHLEPVTHQENLRRGLGGAPGGRWLAAKTHCPAGHAYDAANTCVKRGRRHCRTCDRAYDRIRAAARYAAMTPEQRTAKLARDAATARARRLKNTLDKETP